MIITGYQGIGKSTLAKKHDRIIDLESSCFWKYDYNQDLTPIEESKTRAEDWYIYYCQVAQDLSRQGYVVFVSCHLVVREWLNRHNEETFCAIFPSISIKDDWISRLRERYNASKSDKDLKALKHAEVYYDQDIHQLFRECSLGMEYYRDAHIIKDINYDLLDIVNKLLEGESEFKNKPYRPIGDI